MEEAWEAWCSGRWPTTGPEHSTVSLAVWSAAVFLEEPDLHLVALQVERGDVGQVVSRWLRLLVALEEPGPMRGWGASAAEEWASAEASVNTVV
ncbi:hypothetical protein EYF80_043875 [Liparis tanakae]|uniref:Uncharacterized protein n=1 Tax=Liparis tanakae TaxID=230148 RepID=A0A4Z2FXC4_9TELE|nr:hypothetical protein EYF80_043875 [Liparis tanakae]